MVKCIIRGCPNSSFNRCRSKVPETFCCLPTIRLREGPLDLERSKLRRRLWLDAIARDDLTEKVLKYDRVCGRHFVKGKAAAPWNVNSSDWVPTLNLSKTKDDTSRRRNVRTQKRNLKKAEASYLFDLKSKSRPSATRKKRRTTTPTAKPTTRCTDGEENEDEAAMTNSGSEIDFEIETCETTTSDGEKSVGEVETAADVKYEIDSAANAAPDGIVHPCRRSEVFATFARFREDGFLCDTTLVADDGREFDAHGVLLAAVSPVFRTAFRDYSRPGRCRINLQGVGASAVEAALRFVYAGELPDEERRDHDRPGEREKLFDALRQLGLVAPPGRLVGNCETDLTTGRKNERSENVANLDSSAHNAAGLPVKTEPEHDDDGRRDTKTEERAGSFTRPERTKNSERRRENGERGRTTIRNEEFWQRIKEEPVDDDDDGFAPIERDDSCARRRLRTSDDDDETKRDFFPVVSDNFDALNGTDHDADSKITVKLIYQYARVKKS